MADFNALETLINAYIKQNGVQAITGQVLNGVLRGMVSALGKGWTIAEGDARPDTDPGTMTGPVAYIAHTAGTYTHFGNLVVNDGEVAFLKYNEQTWTKEVLASIAATASVDGNVGTPSVTTSFVNGVLNFAFQNLKGNPGEDGTDGDAAGFGTVAATVDNTIGTPAVSVSASGPDTAKNFTFAFTGLKGATGVTSAVVTVDNTSGTPQCAVSLVGQELHLDFTGLKGAQGDTGVSADYPIAIVNNVTTNDPTQALSAAMGVQLESEISQLDLKVTENGFNINTYDHSAFTSQTPNLTLSPTIAFSNEGDYVEIKVKAKNNGYILRRDSSYNQPRVMYSAQNTLLIRLTSADTQYSYQNNAVDWDKVQVIKILLKTVTVGSGTTDWVFDYFLDGEKLTSHTLTTQGGVAYFNQLGYNSTMDLYYVKGISGGVSFEYTQFAQIAGIVGVTDVDTSESYEGLVNINNRVDALEIAKAKLDKAVFGEDMYFVFRKVSVLYNCESDFYVYQRLKGNIYSKIAIAFYISTGDKPNGYWRVERTNLVSLDEYGEETLIESQAIVAGENEFVLQWLAGSGYNYDGGYTGGFHYGETIKNVTGAWVEFVADGHILDTSADIPLTPCKSFFYREYSPIYQNNDGTIAAWHLKETRFNDGGYEVMNDVKFVQALDYFAYPGIVCVSRYLSEYAMPENVATITDMGDGEPTQTEQFKSNGHRIHYEGNGYATDVFSEFRAGADDSLCSRVVYNSTSYNKYYRRNPDTPGSIDNRLVAFTKVTIRKM